MTRRGLLDDGLKNVLWAAAALGALAFAAGLKLAPHRAWADLLLSNFYFLALAAAALVFIASQYLAGAGWPTVLRRVPEAMTAYIPAGAALAALLLFGMHSLYHWSHHEAAAADAVLSAKAGYLNATGFAVRAAVAVLAWWAFARAIVLNSRRQDADGDPARTTRNRALSAAFLIVYGVTFTLVSVDWLMSLEPHWYSTLFPWYVFSGSFVHAIAVVTLLALALRRQGLLEGLNEHHLHDLGKYLFAFASFWAYLWFCQYLLIWYSNIPEETAYYAARATRGWVILQALNVLLNFLAPFALLLAARSKRDERKLAAAALVLCAGRWLDLYIMTMPAGSGSARPHWLDLPVFAGVAAVFLLAFDRAFRAAAPVPARDPYIGESLGHH